MNSSWAGEQQEKPKMKALRYGIFATAVAITAIAQAQTARAGDQPSAREKLIGAWHLSHIDSPGPDGKSVDVPQPVGMLIYTRDGHMSVQLMYPKSASGISNEYVRNGYEASFGNYDLDEAAHTLTHHVQGSNTGDLLVGKDLARIFQFAEDGHLIIKPARPDEHWSVTWEHY
jgi:Lipocalin-like domain